MTAIPQTLRRAILRLPLETRVSAHEQVLVSAAQISAGVGNLLFALAVARILDPASFADLAAFLGLYLLVHLPAGSLSAGAALAPARAAALRARVLTIGCLGAVGLAAAAAPLGALLEIGTPLLLALSVTVPVAGLLALEQGPLFAAGLHRRAVASLLLEPAVRLGLGLPLAAAVGAAGAAAGVVAAGAAALALVSWRGPDDPRRTLQRPSAGVSTPGDTASRFGSTMLVFLLLALIPQQNLLVANRLLPPLQAAAFAAVAVIGSTAAHVTATIPTVLLPRAGGRGRAALPTALGLAAVLGGAAVVIVALAPEAIITVLFGARYAGAAALAVAYTAAMALFGVTRVLVAQRCATGNPRRLVAVMVLVAVTQLVLLLTARDPHEVVTAAWAGVVLLAAGMGLSELVRLPATRGWTARLRLPGWRSPLVTVTAVTLAGLVLRLLATRGLWLDEATSVAQAQLPFSEMIRSLRTSDVHPPLHHALLWSTARLFGTGELAMRGPSILLGTLLVPLLYRAGRDLFDRRTGLAAAVLGACAPFLIWYSQEARMYAAYMVFGLVAIWAQVLAVRDGRPRHWALYVLATTALLWTQYFGVLQVLVQQAWFLVAVVTRRRANRPAARLLTGWVLATVLCLAAVAPLAPFALDQYTVNAAKTAESPQLPAQAGAAVEVPAVPADPSIYVVAANLIWAVWGYHSDRTMAQLVALWPLGLLFCLVLLGRGRSTKTTVLLAAALAFPVLALYALGFRHRFVFEVRYFANVVPLIMILGGRFLSTLAQRTSVAAFCATGVLAASMLGGFADQQLNSDNPRRYDFEGALAVVAEHAEPGDVLLYEPSYLHSVIGYYEPQLEARSLRQGLPERGPGRVFVLASFLDSPGHAAETNRAIARLQAERALEWELRRPQIRVWTYR
jgi:O-antigen/teichoic acid export membrane protein